MLKFLVRTIAIAITLVIIAFGALIAFVLLVDPNVYKDRIEAAASETLQLPVAIGNIRLQAFPILRVSLEDASIGNPKEFKGSLLETKRMAVSISLIPLLRKRLEIGKILIEQPKINLITAKSGKSNWEPLTATAKSSDKKAKAAPIAFAISRISIDDAILRWRNLQADKDWQATDLNLTVGALILEQETDIALEAAIREHRSGSGADVDGQFEVTVSPAARIIDIANFDISLESNNEKARQRPKIDMNGTAKIDLEKESVKINLSPLSVFGGELKGTLSASLKGEVPQWRIAGYISDLAMHEMLKFIEPEEKPLLQGKLNVDYNLKAGGTTDKEIRRSLSGDMKFLLEDAELKHSSLISNVERALAYFEKRKRRKSGQILKVDSLTASASINKGRVMNKDLRVDTPLLHIKGGGQFYLPDNSINYQLLIGTSKQKEADRIYIPIKISGTLEEPIYKVEPRKLIDNTVEKAKDKIETIEKKVDEVTEKIEDKVDNVLDKIRKFRF